MSWIIRNGFRSSVTREENVRHPMMPIPKDNTLFWN